MSAHPTDAVLDLLMGHQRLLHDGDGTHGRRCARCRDAQRGRIDVHVRAGRAIPMLLPAFPAKSPNPDKVLGHLPDLAEELSIAFLEELCARVAEVHPPGAHLIICSDGRVFNDVVGIPDAHVSAYQREMADVLRRLGTAHISLYSLDDVYPGTDPAAMRRKLWADHAPELEALRDEVRGGGPMLGLYRGITRFLYEDARTPAFQGSNATLQRESRKRAYEVIGRSQAWGNLLSVLHPDAVRLSIHPQPCGHEKFGIFLQHTGDEDRWLTPWHAVAVEERGRFRLMKHRAAKDAGGRLVLRDGRPSHYVLPTTDHPTSSKG
ncbi:L-tyrosine/L-tryptophan isonitrile synthase family protein [Actinosynnema sp. NPDC053489]|uniref:L-tyrosine/L-tryptophan isonitrile synthase family protein n=1 Tax=Actinosynnema sp. NPDC053489 TaxID=3363916 RepID=UPI0037C7267C